MFLKSQGLLEAHDNIAEQYLSKNGTEEEAGPLEEKSKKKVAITGTSNMSLDSEDSNVHYAQPIRIISLRKSPTQPLVSHRIKMMNDAPKFN